MKATIARAIAASQRNELAAITATHGNETAEVQHCDLWMRACASQGVTRQQAMGILRLSPSQFAKAFSVHYGDQNVVMKRFSVGADTPSEAAPVLRKINRAYAVLVAEANGLDVGIAHEYMARCRAFVDSFVDLMEAYRP